MALDFAVPMALIADLLSTREEASAAESVATAVPVAAAVPTVSAVAEASGSCGTGMPNAFAAR